MSENEKLSSVDRHRNSPVQSGPRNVMLVEKKRVQE